MSVILRQVHVPMEAEKDMIISLDELLRGVWKQKSWQLIYVYLNPLVQTSWDPFHSEIFNRYEQDWFHLWFEHILLRFLSQQFP